jgi:hypothetical protein
MSDNEDFNPLTNGGSGRAKRTRQMMEQELITLRNLIVKGGRPFQICSIMKISYSQYLRYMDRLAEQDKRILQDDKRARNAAVVEMSVLKDRLTDCIRKCNEIISDPNESTALKLDTIKILAELSVGTAKIGMQGPTIVRQMSPFVADLALGRKSPDALRPQTELPPLDKPAVEILQAKSGEERLAEVLRKRTREAIVQNPSVDPEPDDGREFDDLDGDDTVTEEGAYDAMKDKEGTG